jgi:hypothetical protein
LIVTPCDTASFTILDSLRLLLWNSGLASTTNLGDAKCQHDPTRNPGHVRREHLHHAAFMNEIPPYLQNAYARRNRHICGTILVTFLDEILRTNTLHTAYYCCHKLFQLCFHSPARHLSVEFSLYVLHRSYENNIVLPYHHHIHCYAAFVVQHASVGFLAQFACHQNNSYVYIMTYCWDNPS